MEKQKIQEAKNSYIIKELQEVSLSPKPFRLMLGQSVVASLLRTTSTLLIECGEVEPVSAWSHHPLHSSLFGAGKYSAGC